MPWTSALEYGEHPVRRVIVFRHSGEDIAWQDGRDRWAHELTDSAAADCPAEYVNAEHPLFLLYTSGSTGKPKGIQHSTAGYLLHARLTCRWVFDLREDDVFWCTADVGWITGHSYVAYGPLASGATVVIYEGAPTWPHGGRFWEICERYGVTVFYTAPTAIRALMKLGDELPAQHDLSSLRLLGTVGEPINPEAWMWYHRVIGNGECPIVDTWWQTETGGIMISPVPGVTSTKPGSCTRPLPGVQAAIVDENGEEITEPDRGGYLVIRHPWPSMLRNIWGDSERYRETYFGKFGDDCYITGDSARRDADGYFWIMGRLDDVVNVSGHRLGTMEVESALVAHPSVAEAAVVSRPHEIKGESIFAFVVLKSVAAGMRGRLALPWEGGRLALREGGTPSLPGTPRLGRRTAWPHRPPRRPPHRRGPPQDPLRQDHAPPAPLHRPRRRNQPGHLHPRKRRPRPPAHAPLSQRRRRPESSGVIPEYNASLEKSFHFS